MYMELLLRDERREARKKGLAEGLAEGRTQGRAEGSKVINLLNKKLLDDDRMNDLQKSITDEAYQQKLLKEYSLN